MRIIPAIDIMDGNVVRLRKGNPDDKVTYSNNPIDIAKKWEISGADILHVVDLDAALSTNKNNIEIISKLIDAVNIPVQVAGGIRSIEAINEMFSKNAAKVVLGTMAYKEPDSIRHIAKRKGEKIIVSIDQNDGKIMINGWREIAGPRIDEAINLFMSMGIREFLVTSVDRDGMLTGPDILTLSYATSFQGVRIIASGGISSIEDVIRVRSIGCSSVILGKSLYDNNLSIEKVKALV
jgi:phosphoribosylformimino-5-aminoimidazole carboxamide ribotide isomerase